MYALKICLYTDGDFGYKDTEFNMGQEMDTMIFYFEKREDAVEAFLRHFYSVGKSIRGRDTDDIKQWFADWNERIKLILKKVPTFEMKEGFGNPEILYGLYEVNRKTLSNGSFYFTEKPVGIYLSDYYNDWIDWEQLEAMDIIQEN